MQIASTPSIPVATPGPAKEIPAGTPPPVDQAPDTKEAVKRVGLQFDKQQQVAIQREWDKPVTQNERVGGIPQDYYEHAFAPPMPGYGYWPTREYSQSANGGSTDMGPVGVNREVPVYEADGKPKMEHVSQTLTEKTHNQKTTTLVGGGVGAVLGAGLAVGVLAAMGGLGGAAGVVGGLMGGVAGAAAGAAAGYKAVAGDKIEEVWMKEQILHPHMTGYTERITPDVWHEQRPVHGGPGRHFGPGGPGGPGHRPGPGGPGGPGHHPGPGGPGGGPPPQRYETWSHLRGYEHDFYPNISYTKAGEFTYPTLQHTSNVSPLGAGFIAAGVGAGAGLATALAVKFLPMLL